MNILITGALGFTGRHLYSYLVKDKSLILYRSDLQAESEYKNYICCDLLQLENANELVKKIKPDRIYQLVGSFTNDYEKDYAANVLVSRHILEAVKAINKPCRVLLIGSAAEYGFIYKQDNPVKETHSLKPANIYGLTKVYQTYLMNYYFNFHRLDIIMARPFNIYGKGMSEELFYGTLYQQIEQITKGERQTIKVGNLENERDYIPIEQVVEYYINIMNSGLSGEIYNVGTGIPTKTRVLLENILREKGLDMGIIEETTIERNKSYDVPQIYADITKLNQLN